MLTERNAGVNDTFKLSFLVGVLPTALSVGTINLMEHELTVTHTVDEHETHTHTCCLHKELPPFCGETLDWGALRFGIGHYLSQHLHTGHIHTDTHGHIIINYLL